MDLWIDCFGVFKLGVSEAAVHNGNTRLPYMHVELDTSAFFPFNGSAGSVCSRCHLNVHPFLIALLARFST